VAHLRRKAPFGATGELVELKLPAVFGAFGR